MTGTIQFDNCVVNLRPGYAETVFADGAKVPAKPQDTDQYRSSAIRYGYGDDTTAMSREHEILHTFLAQKLGLPNSPTLWAVAHPHDPDIATIPEQHKEEAMVLTFQTYLNGGEPTSDLDALRVAGHDPEDLKREALALLRD